MFFDQTMVCIKLYLLVKFNKLNKTAFLTKGHTKKTDAIMSIVAMVDHFWAWAVRKNQPCF